MKHLYDETQDKTGGAHTASLVDADGNLRYKAIDIGRHNAIDKVVGMAFMNGDDLSRMFLVSSGRQPAGMVMKAVRAGIPLIISKSAPISSGIDSARRANITLCCYATAEKVKVFSAPERIVEP
jgi:FdhD protein